MIFRSLLVAASAAAVNAHICLMNPVQRGGFNVSDPGDNSCFQPNGPCGNAPSGNPVATFLGGQGNGVSFQQNLNHYNPGYPGYIDIGYAPFPAKSDDEFIVLATVPDYWAHLQAAQHNFSVPVLMPNIDCDHCVLRIRYVPHKQTEPIFHQCADIAIASTPAPSSSIGRTFVFVTDGSGSGGAGANPSGRSRSELLFEVQPSGLVMPVDTKIGYSMEFTEGAVTGVNSSIYALARPLPYNPVQTDTLNNLLFSYDIPTLTQNSVNITLAPGVTDPMPTQWDTVVAASGLPGGLAIVGRTMFDNGTWSYQVRLLDASSATVGPILALSTAQDTFVNFMWATKVVVSGAAASHSPRSVRGGAVDASAGATGTLYILGGDENSLFALNAAIFTAVIDPSASAPSIMASVKQDVSKYTISALTWSDSTQQLVSVSPGLYGESQYTLVAVDPTTGSVAPVSADSAPIVPANTFGWSYKGPVYGDGIDNNGQLLHLFTRPGADDGSGGSNVLARIDVATGTITDPASVPTLITGVNNEMGLMSPILLADLAPQSA